MRIIGAMEKLIETLCQAERQSRREFIASLVPWMRKTCRICGDLHSQKADLCSTCSKRYLER